MPSKSTCSWCGQSYFGSYCKNCWGKTFHSDRRCPICGLPVQWCKCGMGWNKEKIDISFDLWMVDKFNFNPIKTHEHNHEKRTLMITNKWEDIATLMCENLITIIKYKEACKQNNEKITKNETMHDYILTRLENIEGAYSCLYINGKLKDEEFNYFERNQKAILFMLEGEGDDVDKLKDYFKEENWKDEIIFKDYINTILNSSFFKENDIRIE